MKIFENFINESEETTLLGNLDKNITQLKLGLTKKNYNTVLNSIDFDLKKLVKINNVVKLYRHQVKNVTTNLSRLESYTKIGNSVDKLIGGSSASEFKDMVIFGAKRSNNIYTMRNGKDMMMIFCRILGAFSWVTNKQKLDNYERSSNPLQNALNALDADRAGKKVFYDDTENWTQCCVVYKLIADNNGVIKANDFVITTSDRIQTLKDMFKVFGMESKMKDFIPLADRFKLRDLKTGKELKRVEPDYDPYEGGNMWTYWGD